MDRTLPLQSVPNARDLGGLATPDGRRVAPRRIFRSGTLHRITEGDRSALEALGIRTVIDLRSSWERGREPYEWPAVHIVTAPLVTDELVASIYDAFNAGTLTEDQLMDWWGLTRVPQSLDTHIDSIRIIITTLLDIPPGEAVLYHCSGGKDRTGLISVVVLEALGVARSEILTDFLMTNTQLDADATAAQLGARIQAARGAPLSPAAVFSLTGVKAEWLDSLFRWMAERYGSVERYLTDHVGLGAEDLSILREGYLTALDDLS